MQTQFYESSCILMFHTNCASRWTIAGFGRLLVPVCDKERCRHEAIGNNNRKLGTEKRENGAIIKRELNAFDDSSMTLNYLSRELRLRAREDGAAGLLDRKEWTK